jgi:hypothetical protein
MCGIFLYPMKGEFGEIFFSNWWEMTVQAMASSGFNLLFE